MKIDIYGLLGMIKDNKAPKKILFNDEEWEWYKFDYKNKNSWELFDEYVITDILDNEVTILETTITYNGVQKCTEVTNKIEKVYTYDLCNSDFQRRCDDGYNLCATEIINEAFGEYSYKINEIIDKLNGE